MRRREIGPLKPDDLEDLSRFLTAGFRAAPDAEFARPDVLRWKYLESRGDGDERPRSFLARDDQGQVIGHIGVCWTVLQGRGLPAEGIASLHMMDWLGTPGQGAVGVSLMRRANAGATIQHGIGGSSDAYDVGTRGGYVLRGPLPIYRRVLRPLHWLRTRGLSPAGRTLRAGRDLGRRLLRPSRRPSMAVSLERVDAFGDEIAPVVREAKAHEILTDRTPARLNHLLRYPGQAMSGWHILDAAGRPMGFAMLNVVPQHGGRVREGKIVDCLLGSTDAAAWHAAIDALSLELASAGADLVHTFAGTPWMIEGLRRAGFATRASLGFFIRDRKGLVPEGVPFHQTPIEADYGFT
jgi:hypothetical protein